MKILLKVTAGPEHSFSVVKDDSDYFYKEFHYHPEIELSLILKGEGTRFVGDNIERFSEGDLVLLGPNLPHVWRSDIKEGQKNKIGDSSSIVINFAPGFLGEHFFDTPEFLTVKELLERSSGGIRLSGKIRDEVDKRMRKMLSVSYAERLIMLLDILRKISLSKELKILSSQNILNAYLPTDSERIRKVHQYIIKHFKDHIRLEDVAEAASMSPTAFCRYFRKRTRKTFSSFLTEVRIGYACQILMEKKIKVQQACYESGFSNLSNFNKQFKAVMQVSPSEFLRGHPNFSI